jgi:addiction module HigA family antidote
MTRMHNPAHPGEVLREFLPLDMSIGDIAARLGVSRPHLSRLPNAHTSMTAEMSIKVGPLTGALACLVLTGSFSVCAGVDRNRRRKLICPVF